jgi:hypothetical protein
MPKEGRCGQTNVHMEKKIVDSVKKQNKIDSLKI